MAAPKLRFSEFSGEWEEKRIEDTGIFTRGPFGGSLKKSIFVDSGYKVYEQKNAIQNSLEIGDYYITEEKYKEMIRFSVKKGDLLVSCSGTIGKILVIPEHFPEGIINQALLKISVNSRNNNLFLKELLQNSKMTQYIFGGRGAAIKNVISVKELKSVKISIPSIQEQDKIASFLSKVNEKIEKLEKKQELWETYKKGMMQQLFSQKLRFKDENGEDYPDWEIKKLAEIARFFKGKGIPKEDISNDGIECIRYGELYTTYKEEIKDIVSKTNLNIDELVLSEKNDVVIPTSGETAIDIATASCVMKSGVAIGGDTTIIKTDENGLFISYCLNSQRNEIASLAQGVSVVHLYSSQLKGLKLEIPTIEEQNKIANFLSVVEIRIGQVSRELEINKEFKKGLLQLMFC